MTKSYNINVLLSTIEVVAGNPTDAIAVAQIVIAENYGQEIADDCEYTTEEGK